MSRYYLITLNKAYYLLNQTLIFQSSIKRAEITVYIASKLNFTITSKLSFTPKFLTISNLQ